MMMMMNFRLCFVFLIRILREQRYRLTYRYVTAVIRMKIMVYHDFWFFMTVVIVEVLLGYVCSYRYTGLP